MQSAGSDSWLRLRRGVFLFVLAWFVTMLVTYLLVVRGYGYWLELFNGATWPPQFVSRDANKDGLSGVWFWFCFYLVLSLRTILNLGIVSSATYIFYLLLTGQLKERLMSKFEAVLGVRDTALATHIERRLEASKLPLGPEQLEVMYKAAEEFHGTNAGREIDGSLKSASENRP